MSDAGAAHARFGDYLELTKPRLSLLSVMTALVGYFSARPAFDPLRIGLLALGTSLAAGASPRSTSGWKERRTRG